MSTKTASNEGKAWSPDAAARLPEPAGSPVATTRFARNWNVVARRFRRLPAFRPRLARAVPVVAAALVLLVLEGILFDGPIVGVRGTLPASVLAFFQAATRFGKSDWLLIPSGLLVIAVASGDWRGPPRAVAAAWAEVGALAGVFFVAIAAPGLIADIVKPLVGRARPRALAEGASAFAPFHLGYAHASFPSGHADTMAALAVVAVLALGARALPVVVGAMIVAMSRMVIGVHHFSDVAAGVLLGGAVAYLVVRSAAAAGIGFTLIPGGAVRPRTRSVRRILARAGGPGALIGGFWAAIVGRRG
jgi:membrane-associated phospholipid phosphatase